MTHPTLGYANFRFAGDDAVHLPATPAATMTVACLAAGSEVPFPHEVDAPIDCPDCLNAVAADWWMATLENTRRTGETTSLSGTLDDVRAGMERLMAQAEAVTDETLLGGGASMGQKRLNEISATMRASSFIEATMERARRAPVAPPAALTPPVAMARQLEAADEVLARQLAASPLADLRRFRLPLVPAREPGLAMEGPWRGEAPLIDPGAERVRKAIEVAQQTLEEHPFDEKCDRCNYDTHRCKGCGEPLEHGVEVCDSCDAVDLRDELPFDGGIDEIELTHGGEVVDRGEFDYPDVNWCHVHNRQSQPGREECSECDDERGEGRKAGES
jgi:hypothetical protein